ncbi:thiamine diphosphokinase [Sporolactobacillus shoreae]|uniref:Thiamine diphosphokinase n=1 Tax=Sporolactobacillus shoreae TaxID=1465501 RepID=A0A4Z0GS89_9BACL|nr:thiamine diphosphokinase [Sporolactobacillus shoreae]TGB00243.1 thiamine diphosphokinase [Sporolactobacillus shoreae]
MKMAIVAGGPEELIPDLRTSAYYDFSWIGADRGTFVLLKAGITPVRAFGDFDSLNENEKSVVFDSGVDLKVFPPEKDKTDLELALDWALGHAPEELLIFGATGGRLDHGLAAVQLLLKAERSRVKCSIIDRKNRVTLLSPGTYYVKRNPDYPYLSFLAMSERVEGLTLRGVKYPLDNADLPVGSSLCISNEAASEDMVVSLSTGFLLMMRCSD